MRVAVVGGGGMAGGYRKVYARLPGVEWALAVDVNDAELQACRAEGARRVSAHFADALAAGIDMVDVSTPNHLHEEQACAALAANKHVLLQKPMANSLQAADNILEAARNSRGVLGMYMSSYVLPHVWEIKRLLERGALGKIQSVRARDAHRGGLRTPKNVWRGSRDKTGGGCFIQLSVHAINLMQWWLGSAIAEVSAYSANQHCPNIGGDDVTTAIAAFDSGVFGVFDSGYASEGSTREIFGTQGWLRINAEREIEIVMDQPYADGLIQYTTPGKKALFQLPGRALDDASNPHNPQRMFIESVLAGKPPHMSGAQGRQDLAVVMAAYESAEKKQPIKVH